MRSAFHFKITFPTSIAIFFWWLNCSCLRSIFFIAICFTIRQNTFCPSTRPFLVLWPHLRHATLNGLQDRDIGLFANFKLVFLALKQKSDHYLLFIRLEQNEATRIQVEIINFLQSICKQPNMEDPQSLFQLLKLHIFCPSPFRRMESGLETKETNGHWNQYVDGRRLF